MKWSFEPDRPIYIQIMDEIKSRIISGEYKPGYRLESVRELAADASVNPNTMQKALSELEREGLVFAQRTSGRMITEDKVMIEQLKSKTALSYIDAFLEKMQTMGYSPKEILVILEKTVKEKAQ
ncbi:MAG: GntR family transcriptional regulator [Bacillota bacterium]|nr:GntR family transcriptional regulator [Bacillota bacterium]